MSQPYRPPRPVTGIALLFSEGRRREEEIGGGKEERGCNFQLLSWYGRLLLDVCTAVKYRSCSYTL
jgi:hypothetical protein